LGGRKIELGQAEVGAPDVQAHKVVIAVKAHLAVLLIYEVSVGRSSAPGRPLFGAESSPATRDRANVVAMALLLGGTGIAGRHVLARDLDVARLGIDDIPLPAPLWNGLHFHVTSRTHLLRCWFTRPQCICLAERGHSCPQQL